MLAICCFFTGGEFWRLNMIKNVRTKITLCLKLHNQKQFFPVKQLLYLRINPRIPLQQPGRVAAVAWPLFDQSLALELPQDVCFYCIQKMTRSSHQQIVKCPQIKYYTLLLLCTTQLEAQLYSQHYWRKHQTFSKMQMKANNQAKLKSLYHIQVGHKQNCGRLNPVC